MFSFSLDDTRLRLAALLVLATAAVAEADERIEFVRDVVPALTKAGCNGGKCHGSFQGRGGFRLSLLGFNPGEDYESLVKQARGRRVSLAAPPSSLLLRKPLGALPHGGGRRFGEDDPAYEVLLRWIDQGAPPPGDVAVTRIVVQPEEIVLESGDSVALHVQAVWSDGVVRDVTQWAMYEVREDRYAEVDPRGRTAANLPGRTAVTVTFMGQVAAVTMTVPFEGARRDTPLADTTHGTPGNFIDEILAAEWRKLGLQPSRVADDYEFLRRAHLDIIGTLPTPDEVRQFAGSAEPEKRRELIDRLLERPEYVDYWSTKWADLLRVHRRYVGDKGLWTFWGWLRQAMRENWPVDRIARELLTSRGSLFTNGATAFYYVDQKPEELAETTSQLFLGVRIQCAKCHHHPYEVWSQEDYYGLANFFTRLELKDNQDGGRYGGAKLLRPIATANRDRQVAMTMPPKIFGHEIDPQQTTDVRRELADWITAPDNGYFDRNFVNRYWSYLMGRGLVEPIDDLRATNPPSIPDLLEALEEDFVAHGRDLKHLIRTICNSHAYQLAGDPVPQQDREGMFYTHHRYRRLPAAVLLDAVNQATETSESFAGLPSGTRAISLPDPTIQSYFLTAFGRSLRNSPCECATSTDPNLGQALHLINSTAIDAKVKSASGRVARLLKSARPVSEIVDELFLSTVSRPPTESEVAKIEKLFGETASDAEDLQDLMWTLLNSTEFVFNH